MEIKISIAYCSFQLYYQIIIYFYSKITFNNNNNTPSKFLTVIILIFFDNRTLMITNRNNFSSCLLLIMRYTLVSFYGLISIASLLLLPLSVLNLFLCIVFIFDDLYIFLLFLFMF